MGQLFSSPTNSLAQRVSDKWFSFCTKTQEPLLGPLLREVYVKEVEDIYIKISKTFSKKRPQQETH